MYISLHRHTFYTFLEFKNTIMESCQKNAHFSDGIPWISKESVFTLKGHIVEQLLQFIKTNWCALNYIRTNVENYTSRNGHIIWHLQKIYKILNPEKLINQQFGIFYYSISFYQALIATFKMLEYYLVKFLFFCNETMVF